MESRKDIELKYYKIIFDGDVLLNKPVYYREHPDGTVEVYIRDIGWMNRAAFESGINFHKLATSVTEAEVLIECL